MSNEIAVEKKKRVKMSKNRLQLYSLCAIPVFLVFLFHYIPMVGIVIAFKDYKYNLGILGSKWVGLDNIMFFLKGQDFYKITRNTLVLNALFITVGIVAAVALAVLLFEVTSRRVTKVVQTIMIMPNFLSWVIVGCIAYAFLNPQFGLINKALMSMGHEGIQWYNDGTWWPLILLIVSIWKHVGMDSVLYYATLMGVDSSLVEAAQIDGANKWKVIMNIYVPALVPVLTIITITKIGAIFRADFGLFYQLTRDQGALFDATDVIDTYVFRTMRVYGDMGMSAAIGLLQSLVGFVMVIITNTVVRKVDPQNSLF